MRSQWFQRLVPLLVPLLAIPALWHLLVEGLPQDTADGTLHLYRLALIEKHVGAGMLYPRWLPELALGRGYPLLNFYGPASYYLALIFRALGLPLASSLVAAFAVLIVAAGFGAYLLARDTLRTESRLPALVAATAYMYAPYLLTNAYARGALAEVAAQALLPWIFWSTGRLMAQPEKRSLYFILVAFSLAGLAVTHNITLLFLPLPWLLFVAVTWLTRGRRRDESLWPLAAAAAALGLSAFFTLPMAAERQYLATRAYEIAAQTLPASGWTWRNFLDTAITFAYTAEPPFRLGLAQLALAVGGLFVARRRDAVWLYWAGVALVSSLLIGAWAAPLWLNNEFLMVAQFQWRLLTLLCLPLALFTGALVAAISRPAARLAATGALIALIVAPNTPRLTSAWGWPPQQDGVAVAGVSRFERDSGALGTSSVGEFIPKWAGSTLPGPVEEATRAPSPLAVRAGNDFRLSLETSGERPGPLRMMTFYFPGWRAVDETGAPLATSPSTRSGLLTIDAPAGRHEITVWWEPTLVERAGVLLTVVTLLSFSLYALARRQARPLAPIALLFLTFVSVAALTKPPVKAVGAPSETVTSGGVRALGARLKPADGGLWVYPYWYTEKAPEADLRVRWQVRASDGSVVTVREARPYHNATSAAEWPSNTLVDDAHFIPLPDGLPAGEYDLWGQLLSEENASEPAKFGSFALDSAAPSRPPPARLLDATFGDAVALLGYDLPASSLVPPPRIDAVAQPGDVVRYALRWRALKSMDRDYHGFTHLVDASGDTLATRDQLAGGERYLGTSLWGTGNDQIDSYPLRIPAGAKPGVYWPVVGLYDFETLERLPVSRGEYAGQDAARLRPIKVRGLKAPTATKPMDVGIEGLARLTGYDLQLPANGLTPGATFTVTLFYQAQQTTETGHTRFLHLFSDELGMAAQADSPPAGGSNPTWSWVPGEVIEDTAALTISPAAKPGRYELRAGLYDPANGRRLPLTGKSGERLADDVAVVATVDVVPPD